MWKPRRFRKQPQLLTEYTSHIFRYELEHPQDKIKMILTVHLPSKRVSESHYDMAGILKSYVHSSPIADEHIAYLCSRDKRLDGFIKKASEAKVQYDSTIANRKEIYQIFWTFIKYTFIALGIWVIITIFLLPTIGDVL